MQIDDPRAARQQAFRLFRPENPAAALGMAVNFLMAKPAFAKLRFGDWSRILAGQVNCGHYVFVLDKAGKPCGFAGWALTSVEKAEAWVEGRAPLSYQDSLAGECVVFNAWSAETKDAHRYMVDVTRTNMLEKKTLYFKRHYADGTVRPVRLPVNQFVSGHAASKRAAASS